MKIHKYAVLGLGLMALTASAPFTAFAQTATPRPVPIRQSAGDVARLGNPRSASELDVAVLSMPTSKSEVYRILDEARADRGDADAALLARYFTLFTSSGRSGSALDWMRDVAFLDGSSDLVIILADTLWTIAISGGDVSDSRATKFAEGSRAFTLLGYVLIIVDGARCADQTAAGARMSKVMPHRAVRFEHSESWSEQTREVMRNIAIRGEQKTANARRPDPRVCMDGVAEFFRATESEGATQSARPGEPTGHYGTVIETKPGSSYLPEYLPATQQAEAMAKAREVAAQFIVGLVP